MPVALHIAVTAIVIHYKQLIENRPKLTPIQIPEVAFSTQYTVELGYNDIGLYDISCITSDILWYQLIPHC